MYTYFTEGSINYRQDRGNPRTWSGCAPSAVCPAYLLKIRAASRSTGIKFFRSCDRYDSCCISPLTVKPDLRWCVVDSSIRSSLALGLSWWHGYYQACIKFETVVCIYLDATSNRMWQNSWELSPATKFRPLSRSRWQSWVEFCRKDPVVFNGFFTMAVRSIVDREPPQWCPLSLSVQDDRATNPSCNLWGIKLAFLALVLLLTVL